MSELDETQTSRAIMAKRNPLAELTNYDVTMKSLLAYLLAAYERHPGPLMNGRDSRVKPDNLKLMQRCLRALLACGLTADVEEVQAVSRYFTLPLAQPEPQIINFAEMQRLEGLLHLNSSDVLVIPRLRLLMNQRQADGTYTIEEFQQMWPHNPIIGTLWAVRLLTLARTRPAAAALIDDDALRYSLDQIYPIVARRRERDLSLLLRLYDDLNGSLTNDQQRTLKKLITKAENSGGLWGLRSSSMTEDLLVAIHQRRLPMRYVETVDEDGDTVEMRNPMAEQMRDVIVSTCTVIDNLAPLCHRYPMIVGALEQSMTLWWELFCGDDAPLTLNTLFPDEQEFLTVLSMTLIAASAYTGEMLKERAWLTELRSHAKKFTSTSDKESVAQALRHWLDVEIHNPKALELGLSGSNVMRFTPFVKLHQLWALPLEHLSLIVKYGRHEEIEAERQNYQVIPLSIRKHFVKLPDKSYDNQQGMTFVIMEDLVDYETIFESYEKFVEGHERAFSRALMKMLREVHWVQRSTSATATSRHVRDLYVVPMLNEAEQILGMAEYIRRRSGRDLLDTKAFESIDKILRSLMTTANELSDFPLAFMHGDLHTRNIMVRLGNTRRREYTFRLIDLEKVRLEGDMAHDAGQLLADLDFLAVNAKRPLSPSAVRLRDYIREDYLRLARERQDEYFGLRLELAMARAYMRITKGRFKRALRHMDNRELREANSFIFDTLGLISSTQDTLEDLMRMLE